MDNKPTANLLCVWVFGIFVKCLKCVTFYYHSLSDSVGWFVVGCVYPTWKSVIEIQKSPERWLTWRRPTADEQAAQKQTAPVQTQWSSTRWQAWSRKHTIPDEWLVLLTGDLWKEVRCETERGLSCEGKPNQIRVGSSTEQMCRSGKARQMQGVKWPSF